MTPIYLGVDVGGMNNTWMATLSVNGDRLAVVHGPHLASLIEIAEYCETSDVVAVAIDAQLTAALSEENGFRTSDEELQDMLPPECQRWVASASSLMAVPVRGRLLADHLAPMVGTIIETHPRASLLFGLGEEALAPLRNYRENSDLGRGHVQFLWQSWSERFGIMYDEPVVNDGALDSIVCATVAYCFHRETETLHRLRHEATCKVGRGPFYVVAPTERPAAETGWDT